MRYAITPVPDETPDVTFARLEAAFAAGES